MKSTLTCPSLACHRPTSQSVLDFFLFVRINHQSGCFGGGGPGGPQSAPGRRRSCSLADSRYCSWRRSRPGRSARWSGSRPARTHTKTDSLDQGANFTALAFDPVSQAAIAFGVEAFGMNIGDGAPASVARPRTPRSCFRRRIKQAAFALLLVAVSNSAS